ncbi:DUF805 domain-containing protein [Oceanibium sediminis]|uniref:DUF805 domain-containing protein n=1 Tax=Oceanibium sediminis TaxID=2026339 RepID=UPI000DD4E5D1|nr:DUF805 domain-containing protein [Oceanibium sediminis]
MNIITATKTCFRKYITFSGRATRSEYWWFFVAVMLMNIAASLIDGFMGITNPEAMGPVEMVVSFGVFLPMLSAAVRRLHDTGRPGFYVLVPIVCGSISGSLVALAMLQSVLLMLLAGLIGIAGFVVYIYWLVKPSDPGPNRYGPHPSEPQDYGEVFQ